MKQKKQLLVTVQENEVNGNINVTINGITTFVPEENHRQLWAMLKGGTPPKLALSFVPPNHPNAVRIVKDFTFPTVRKFVSDVLKVDQAKIELLFTCSFQTIVVIAEADGDYTYSIDHMSLV